MLNRVELAPGLSVSVELPSYEGNRLLAFNEDAYRRIQTSVVQEGEYEIIAEVETIRPLENAGLVLRFEIEPWDAAGYVILPGAVYAGNRFESRELGYPPLLSDPADIRKDSPIIIGNLSRLSKTGKSELQQLSADLAWPAVGALNLQTGDAWVITFSGFVGERATGITIEESSSRDRLAISVSAPGVRFLARDAVWAGRDRGIPLKTGDQIRLEACVKHFKCTSHAQLFEVLCVTQPHHSIRPTVPFSEAARLVREHYQRDNWNSSLGWYSSSVVESDEASTQLGWVGGLQTGVPLLIDGEPSVQERVEISTRTLLSAGIAPSGLVHGFVSALGPCQDGFGLPHAENWNLVRKSCDVLFSIVNLTDVLRAAGSSDPDQHLWAVDKTATALSEIWQQNRQFGQFLDIETREIIVGGSTCGALGPAGLAKAARILERPEFLTAARESAIQFHQNILRDGFTSGGPGDALQAPDSESAFALLESFVTLYEETLEGNWLVAAADAAWLALTWVVPYNFPFPPSSALGKIGAQSAGTVLANVQNKHSAPGICTLDPSALLRLYRATGEEAFLEAGVAIARSIPQYVSRPNRPIGNMPSGWICERVNLSDWESEWGRGPGEIFDGSCWCEASMLLTAVNFPGVYVRRDLGRAWCADHVEVALDGDTLTIQNPTRFPAAVRVLTDDDLSLSTNLTSTTIPLLPKVSVHAGGAVTILLDSRFCF